jgi:ribosome biogenesis GTPase
VDIAFLVTGLDGNFRLRRIERYVTLAEESGAEPVVVLSKADLADDVFLRIRQAEGAAPLCPVLAVSAVDGTGLAALAGWLGPGRTGAFLGSSGVGKSTLVNRLLGEERLATKEVRADDDRGRHTTTRRELIVLPGDCGVVIDTPGMREIQLRGDESSLAGSFAEVEAFAAGCRFRDCRHEDEPGCAVHRALADGDLDPDRYESYVEQRRELAYQERRRDDRLRRAEEDRWRRIAIWRRKRPRRGGRDDAR